MAECYRVGNNALPALKLRIALPCVVLIAAWVMCPGKQVRASMGQGAGGEGKRSFATRCATCHGLDGRGGEHAPAIVGTPAAQVRTDNALAGVIRNGIPDKGMPSFHFLTSRQIAEIVRYIRLLRGTGERAASGKGDPAAGAKLFFGVARCSDCHMMQGQGGFVGSDLSEFGSNHSASELRQIILFPNKFLVPRWQLVRVVTNSGQHFSGLVRTEDNFSIALLSKDGVFHLLMKSGIAQITREPRSIMPDDYGKELSAKQLDDLVSFVVDGLANKSHGKNGAGALRPR